MKQKSNPLKINKGLQKAILGLVLIIIVVSILLFAFSLGSSKKANVQYKSFGSNKFSSKGHRSFNIESAEENIYNLGQYEVNLNRRKLLILNLSIQCNEEAFETIQEKNILIQNAVIQTFADYGSMTMATSPKGKDKIKKNILDNINNSLHKPLVTQVYFNTFIIQ